MLILMDANDSRPGSVKRACNDCDVLEYPPSIHNPGWSIRREEAMPELKSGWLLN
jgi:hypothetical protein